MIVIFGHAAYIDGKIYEAPVNTLVETLIGEKKDFIFVRHSLDGNLTSKLYQYKDGKVVKESKLFSIKKVAVLGYIANIISGLFYFLQHGESDNILICVDPLNALTGIWLKKLKKAKKVVFYTSDYSPKRFKNDILDWIFKAIDRYCLKNADQIWNASSRIWKVRAKMGVKRTKNILVPNVPSDEYKKFISNKKNPYHLITLGMLSDQLDFIEIFKAMKDLSARYPKIMLKVIGNGPKEKEYRDYVKKYKLDGIVKFYGYLEHSKALEEISRSGIGLALYNGKVGFNYYGDSMKCREYFCFGLPVLTTDTHSTVEEIRQSQSGEVCELDKDDYIKKLSKILDNYSKYAKKSIELSMCYKDIHSDLIKRLEGAR